MKHSNVKSSPGFDKIYRTEDPWGTSKHQSRLKLACKYLKGNEQRVLDVGCGDGKLFDYISSTTRLFGVDISKVAVKLARQRRPKASFKVADVRDLPFPSNYFDFVFCLEVLYYLPDDKKALNEVKRVMRGGGRSMIGLTLGHPYYDYYEITKKIKSRFDILNEEFILPKPFPQFLNRWGRFGLFFYKLLPFWAKIKVYILVEKR